MTVLLIEGEVVAAVLLPLEQLFQQVLLLQEVLLQQVLVVLEQHQVLMEHQQRELVAAGVVDTLVQEAQEDLAEAVQEDPAEAQDQQTPEAVAEEELIHYHKEMVLQVDLEL